MKIAAALSMGAVLIGMIGATNLYAKDSPYAKLDMAPDKTGPYTDAIDIRTLCGTKPVRVALSDGFFANSWRKTALAELKDEASKCPNITEVIHTDAQGSAQKQIADIQGLAAQRRHHTCVSGFRSGAHQGDARRDGRRLDCRSV